MNTETQDREGVDRAFDVIRNHTVHTKGYVLTALKLIEEFGTSSDKEMLQNLLKEKNGMIEPNTTQKPIAATGPKKRKSSKTQKAG